MTHEVTFWGTRGSIPTPGPETARYGGNTACISITGPDNRLVILDAGSGLRPLGHMLMGSVAERVVRKAPCPVLTVRHVEREFVLPDHP